MIGGLKQIVKGGLSLLPGPARRFSRKIDYRIASRVSTFRDPHHPSQGLRRGAVVFSLDYELAWAWQYARNPGIDCVALGMREREQVPVIVKQFEQFMIPATWATVGHLFLEKCSRGANGLAHPGMPRPTPFETENWKFAAGDWYQHDPCTDVHRDPAWYAPDLIERILSSRVKHEIGCHTFSHAGLGPYCPPEVAAAEIQACADAMAPYGLKPTTLVFPGNSEGNFDTLAGAGVKIVRAFPRGDVNITLPVLADDGMWRVHVSTALARGNGWTDDERLSRLKKFVNAAADTRMAAHVWLHPSLPPHDLHDIFVPFLAYCAAQRDAGAIDILTMEELVRATEGAR